MNFASILQIVSVIPSVVSALQAIATSDAAKTLEQVFAEFISHITPGQPNSPTLSGK